MKITLLAACLLAAGAAQADDQAGWYVGAGVGTLSYQIDGATFDGEGPLFKVYGGYRFSPYVALEAASISSTVEDDSAYWNDFEVETSAITGQVIGSIPIRIGLSFFGKIGLASWEAEAKNTRSRAYATDDGTDLIYGGGVMYDFKFPLRLRAELEGIAVDDASVGSFTVSAAYRF